MSGFHAIPARPYKGLARFDDSELDERFFFGRERETELVASNLVASRLTVLYGPSGVGKSSLLRAGVVRRLRTLVPAGGESGAGDGALPVVVDAWRDDPLAAIASAAGARAPTTPAELADVLAERAAEVGGEIYLVLDQMEEYFVYHGRDRGGPLRDALAEILARPELRVHVLLGIRDDALAELDALKGRVPGLFANVLRLDHLDVDAARAAIVEPLARLEELGGPHVEAEPALVAAVVDQVASGRIERRLSGKGIVAGAGRRGRVEAPYLQLVMDRIWEVERGRGSSVLHAQTLAELGGSGRIVQQHLERALASLDEPERELVARLFNQLVTPSGTKIAHAVGDLSRYAGESPERLEDVLHALSAERVVRALPGRNGGGARYEIFHDVLADAVLDWGARHEADRALAQEREALRRRHRRLAAIAGLALVALALMGLLTVYAFSQRSEARQQAALAGAARLKAEQSAAAALKARKDAEASARSEIRERQKADKAAARALASEKKAEQRAVEANRQRRRADQATAEAVRRAASEARAKNDAVAAKNDALVAKNDALAAKSEALAAKNDAVVAKDAALRSKREALVSKDKAERATKEAVLERAKSDASARRARVAQTNAEASALVADAVSRLSTDPEHSLRLALDAARKARVFGLEGILRDSLLAIRARRVLPGGGGEVRTVATSADSTLALVPGAVGEARVFELATGKLISRLRHGARLNVAIFSPDGKSVATGDADGVILTWDARSGRELRRFVHGAAIRDLALSPDGRLIASAAGEAARVWFTSNGSPAARLQHPFSVEGVDFNPAGTLLLTQARDVRLFRTGDWGHAPVVLDQPGLIQTAAFAPVGSLVATGGRDDVAMIWESGDGTKRHELRPHTADIVELAWSPNGELVATASADNGGRVFRAATGALESFLGAHSNQVVGIAFSPDGASIATASVDGSGRIWTGPGFARHERLLGHAGQVLDVAYTPDGSKVVTGGEDGSARVWRPAVDPQLTVVGRHAAAGRAVAFSPDGTLIASVGLDSTLRLGRRSGQTVRTIPQPARVVDVAFSSDGTRLITAGLDGIARVWRVRDGSALETYAHGAPLTAAVFDRAGMRALTAGTDGIARIWPRGGGRPRELRHGGGAVAAAVFSPDGRFVATAGVDSEARVWRAATGKLLGKLTGHHDDDLTSIAYSPNGKRLVTTSIDADGHLWDAATFKHLRALSGHSALVSDVAFSADGRWIATAGPTTVGMWETRTGRRIEKGTPALFLRGHLTRVRGVAFAPDSRRVASIGEDGTVRTYLCEVCGTTGELIRTGQRRLAALGSNLTPAERKRYLGG